MRVRYSDYKELILKGIKDGKASTEIVSEMGVGNSSNLLRYVKTNFPELHPILLQYGKEKMKRGNQTFELNLDELKSWLDSLRTLQEFAEFKGVKYDSLKRRIKVNFPNDYLTLSKQSLTNTTIKTVGTRLESKGIDLDLLCTEGKSFNFISEQYDIAPQTVKKYVKQVRPELLDKFLMNGVSNQHRSNLKVTEKDVETMLELSKKGFGIEAISNFLPYDSTTIRNHLMKNLGEDYGKFHSVDRYVNNGGWNGKSIEYNGVTYQSIQEVKVASILESLGLDFKAHTQIKIGGKIYYPDFYLPQLDIFIEYAGMMNKSFYRRKFAKKVSDYSMNNIKCLVVVAETLEELEATLKEMMPNVAIY